MWDCLLLKTDWYLATRYQYSIQNGDTATECLENFSTKPMIVTSVSLGKLFFFPMILSVPFKVTSLLSSVVHWWRPVSVQYSFTTLRIQWFLKLWYCIESTWFLIGRVEQMDPQATKVVLDKLITSIPVSYSKNIYVIISIYAVYQWPWHGMILILKKNAFLWQCVTQTLSVKNMSFYGYSIEAVTSLKLLHVDYISYRVKLIVEKNTGNSQ